ncbi:MAG: DedA family protein [Rickettsiales endosymbiont of Dermacentor nuttalli]
MNKLEAYSYLLADSFMDALLITMHKGFVFHVMKIFGTYSDKLMLLFVVLGCIVAISFNWGLGYILRYCAQKEYITIRSDAYQKIKMYFNKFSYLLLCITFVPVIGAIITTLCGLFKISIFRVIFIGGASYLGYYYFQLI